MGSWPRFSDGFYDIIIVTKEVSVEPDLFTNYPYVSGLCQALHCLDPYKFIVREIHCCAYHLPDAVKKYPDQTPAVRGTVTRKDERLVEERVWEISQHLPARSSQERHWSVMAHSDRTEKQLTYACGILFTAIFIWFILYLHGTFG
jgi:hypothetical protein